MRVMVLGELVLCMIRTKISMHIDPDLKETRHIYIIDQIIKLIYHRCSTTQRNRPMHRKSTQEESRQGNNDDDESRVIFATPQMSS